MAEDLTLTVFDDTGATVVDLKVDSVPRLGHLIRIPASKYKPKRSYFAQLALPNGRRWTYQAEFFDIEGKQAVFTLRPTAVTSTT